MTPVIVVTGRTNQDPSESVIRTHSTSTKVGPERIQGRYDFQFSTQFAALPASDCHSRVGVQHPGLDG